MKSSFQAWLTQTHYAQHPSAAECGDDDDGAAAVSSTVPCAWMWVCFALMFILFLIHSLSSFFRTCNVCITDCGASLCFLLRLWRAHYALDLFTDIGKLFIQPIRHPCRRVSTRTTRVPSSTAGWLWCFAVHALFVRFFASKWPYFIHPWPVESCVVPCGCKSPAKLLSELNK